MSHYKGPSCRPTNSVKALNGKLLCSVMLVYYQILLLCRYLQEYSALGTAGGMYHFRDQILTGNPSLFFVMNADVCGDFPLQEMLEFHRSVDALPHFTILGTEVCD